MTAPRCNSQFSSFTSHIYTQNYMFMIKKITQNTVVIHLNGPGHKNQQNFDNCKIFVLWRNSQLSIKLFERESPSSLPQYRISLIVKIKMEQVQHLCTVINLHLQIFSYTMPDTKYNRNTYQYVCRKIKK